MKIVAIVQARMGSSRLPGKVLQDICGQSMLARVVRRMQRSQRLDEIVIATTTDSADDAIEAHCDDLGVPCYRGAHDDVLDRYWQAAVLHQADVVVRITADCPLVDAEVIDEVVGRYLAAEPAVDFATNARAQSGYPRGLGVEVVRPAALEAAWREATAIPDREHVTLFIYEAPERFRLLWCDLEGEDHWSHRWTVDFPEDIAFVRAALEALDDPEGYGWRDLLALLARRADLVAINSHIDHKAPEVKPRRLVFRVDAGDGVGLGHVGRCLALAELIVDSASGADLGEPLFVVTDDAEARALIAEASFARLSVTGAGEPRDVGATAAALAEGALLVLDGYRFDAAYVEAVRAQASCRVLAFDDRHEWDLPVVDWVLGVGAATEGRTYAHPRAYLGPWFMPSRRRLRELRAELPDQREGAFVALGSSATAESAASVAHVTARHFAPVTLLEPRGGLGTSTGAEEGVTILPRGAALAPAMAPVAICVCGGGVTKYESLLLGRATVVLDQNAIEAEDTRVLVERGLVISVATAEELAAALAHLAEHPEELEAMRRRLAAAGLGSAATRLVNEIAAELIDPAEAR